MNIMRIIYLHNIISIIKMSLNIQKLKITLLTNATNNKPIEFTKDVLYKSPSDIEKYPYITTKQLYPEGYLSKLDYDKIVNIFFNKDNFEEMLNENKPSKNGQDEAYITNKNVMLMLQLLFSTKYFIVNNIHQSLDLLSNTDSNNSIFYNPFNTKISYVKINGKPHTVTKAVWLNDTINHPKYKEVMNTVGDVIASYMTKYPNDPTKLNNEMIRLRTDTVKYDEISYNLRSRLLPTLRFPYRESSNIEIQKSINMDNRIEPEIPLIDMSKKQLYSLITKELLSKEQQEEHKGLLNNLKLRESDSSNKTDYINIINKYNNYTREFYDKFEALYKRYVLNNKDVTIPREILDIGIDNINIGYSDEYPKKEIFVMLDLIDGEVNEDNKKEIYCPYTNEYLGNLLNNLVYDMESSKILKTKKSIYSTEDKKSKSSKMSTNSTSSTSNIKEKSSNTSSRPNMNTSNKDVNSDLFYSQIFNRTENKEIVDKMRPFIKDDDIISFIKKNSELYDIIGKSTTTTSNNKSFMDQINRLNGRYKTEIDILKQNKKGSMRLPIQLQNIDNDILKYEFYSTVLNKIIAYENTKPKSLGGGKKTKTRKSKTKNITKKSR
mgnify:CR=1 FL=1